MMIPPASPPRRHEKSRSQPEATAGAEANGRDPANQPMDPGSAQPSERWSRGRTFRFVVAASLGLWGVILLVGWLLWRFF